MCKKNKVKFNKNKPSYKAILWFNKEKSKFNRNNMYNNSSNEWFNEAWKIVQDFFEQTKTEIIEFKHYKKFGIMRGLKMNNTIDYHFKCISPVDCTLTLEMTAEHKIFNQIFEAAKLKMKKTKGISVNGNIDIVEKFEVPEIYLNFVKTIFSKKVRGIEREVMRDGIFVTHNKPINAFFHRHNDEWLIVIEYKGEWVKR